MVLKNEFMNEAIKQAQIAFDKGEFPVGAVVVKAKAEHQATEIISFAHNMVEHGCNALHHAEILAINDAVRKLGDKYLTKCDIYVTLEPCLMCFKAISLVKIRRLYYGLSNSSDYSIEKLDYGKLDFNHIPEIYGGIGESEMQKLFIEHLKRMRL